MKIPAGGGLAFEVPGEDPESPDSVKEIVGVIVDHYPLNSYWTEKYNGQNVAPNCYSTDSKTGIGNPGGECAKCPYNRFGSGEDGQSTRNITTFDYALYDALIHAKKPSIKNSLQIMQQRTAAFRQRKQKTKIMIWRCNFMRFSVDETKIINMYDTSDRIKLIMDLQQALPHIEDAELTETVSALISKLVGMTDTEFNNIDFSAGEDSEVLDSE